MKKKNKRIVNLTLTVATSLTLLTGCNAPTRATRTTASKKHVSRYATITPDTTTTYTKCAPA